MVTLESYACGEWKKGSGKPRVLRNAVTGEPIAEISSEGIDFGAMLRFGRERGGAALRKMTFPERAAILKKMAGALNERGDELRAIAASYGATPKDARLDVDGGIGTLAFYASLGAKQLPESRILADGEPSPLSKGGNFVGRHVYVPLEGVAVQINAYNFPSWGMLEKLAPAFLAGMPSVVKPATPTAWLTYRIVQILIASGAVPEGTLQLISGSVGDLFSHLTCQDVVSFTGSASTGEKIRSHPTIVRNAVRVNIEADSLNCVLLGPDVEPGSPTFEHFKNEVLSEMTVKAGQKCTAIRRVLVPEARAERRHSRAPREPPSREGRRSRKRRCFDGPARRRRRPHLRARRNRKTQGRSGGRRRGPRAARLRAEGRVLHGARASPLPRSEERPSDS